jgi:uncharacterized protein (TIGR03000 family)
MFRTLRTPAVLALASLALAFVAGRSTAGEPSRFPETAQLLARFQVTPYAPSPNWLDYPIPTPYNPPPPGWELNGLTAGSYSYNVTRGLPTYMTSINYPLVYGSYVFPYPVGRFTTGIQTAGYTTAPSIYNTFTFNASILRGAATSSEAVMKTGPITTAAIEVRLPADAELSFQGESVHQTGSLRRFVSPALVPGSDYTYDVQARWVEDGREVSRSRQVGVRAGDRLTIDFTNDVGEKTAMLHSEPKP